MANESEGTPGHVGRGADRWDLQLKLGGESVTLSRAALWSEQGQLGSGSAGDLGPAASDRPGFGLDWEERYLPLGRERRWVSVVLTNNVHFQR